MTKRTDQQNKSIHKFCELIAEELNNTPDCSVQAVCKLPIAWTKDNFKENVWKPVQHAMYPEINSTTELDTKQVSAVYEQINLLFAEQWGVHVPFPSYENELNESRVN